MIILWSPLNSPPMEKSIWMALSCKLPLGDQELLLIGRCHCQH
jgi:hypothetical protein